MPRLAQAEPTTGNIQFAFSPALDMLNAMYFASLVPQIEGIEGWPSALREQMAPDLLADLDYLYNYPAGDPGIMGTLGDNLSAAPERWRNVDSVLQYLRDIPAGFGDLESAPGVQGLVYLTTFRYPEPAEVAEYQPLEPKQAIERRMRSFDDRDADAIMAAFDRPEDLRERMITLIDRVYHEHYVKELPHRLPALERSVAAHRFETGDPAQIATRLTGREKSCLEAVCPGPFQRHVFMPSLDMGPYNSCAIAGGVHVLYYPLEPEFRGESTEEAEITKLARIHKALSDEQRLRILGLLREREMYAQEIVERTGIHQSVVSRHLSFMKAVGLVTARRQNSMKFFSLNPQMRGELTKTLDIFSPAIGR